MRAIEIARRLAALGQSKNACQAYTLAMNEAEDPAERMEAAVYILQSGGDYKIAYTCFLELYGQGCFREDILPMMTAAFYQPNEKGLRAQYEKNRKLLAKYPYLFRKDFLPFEELPIRFFPYDDRSYVPFYTAEERFGELIDIKNPVVSRNFFKDLEKPILADDVYSQYELEYLSDNVRESEAIGRENHIYLHYTDWGVFCSYLTCLNLRPVLLAQKAVFLIGDEIAQYPIDFKARFNIDYSRCPVRPLKIRDIHRMIWHTQLSSHNGGDFFNEIFDDHPYLLHLPSVFLSTVEETISEIRTTLAKAKSPGEVQKFFSPWGNPSLVEDLYRLKNRTDKDILVALFLREKNVVKTVDSGARIAPAIFFQPHFGNMIYELEVDERGSTILRSEQYEQVQRSAVFQNFKYIKTFTPLRRFTTSHGASVRFADHRRDKDGDVDENGKSTCMPDVLMQRVLNRSFMVDWQDRLYKDSVLVRFEDGKLNPRATFTALAAFLDIPYTESMTYCSVAGDRDPLSFDTNVRGFDTATVFRTYDDYVNEDERYFLEYFLRDAYAYYGYDFISYDGAVVDEQRVEELIAGFTTMNSYMRKSWRSAMEREKIPKGVELLPPDEREARYNREVELLQADFDENRRKVVRRLLQGLRFVNKNGQPLRMMRRLELDPALLEQPLYH